MSTSETTYYAATLLIYSHADKLRTQAIRESIEHGAKGQSAAVARAIKAAASGRRFGKKLETRLNSPLGLINGMPASGRPMSAAGNETDVETEAFLTESEWEGPGAEGARATVRLVSALRAAADSRARTDFNAFWYAALAAIRSPSGQQMASLRPECVRALTALLCVVETCSQ